MYYILSSDIWELVETDAEWLATEKNSGLLKSLGVCGKLLWDSHDFHEDEEPGYLKGAGWEDSLFSPELATQPWVSDFDPQN